jgi:hypothetical protein
VTLRSALSGGRNRGRVYLPPLASSQVDVDGQLTTLGQASVLNVVEEFLEAIAHPTEQTVPVIYSRTSRQTVAIASIDAGRVIDVQRRRRRDLAEARVTRVITP